ncbi:MAG: alpha/beta hydrolase [Erysipelotrichaceae bacterium]
MLDALRENLSYFELYGRMAFQKKIVKPLKIVYGEYKEQYFLYYEPEIVKTNKVIFYIHGGGWNAGSPEFFDFVGQRCAKEGYRFISCGYRLSPKTKYPGQTEDCVKCFEEAMLYLEGKDIDNSNVIVIGPSAGAQLGSILSYNYDYKQIKAFIGLGGPYCFDKGGISVKLLLDMLFEKGYDRREAEAVNCIKRNDIKGLLIQSRHDGVINFDCALKMRDALLNAGNECELYEVEDKYNTHSFYTAGCFMLKSEENKTIKKVFDYIDNL